MENYENLENIIIICIYQKNVVPLQRILEKRTKLA